ncbi:MAG: acyl-CoA thioesterase [Candidatus Marinimicrobia bacterium]|nr:acyl-CoA thioesterase [Candidatus Neomarinimicrobiota bacterium]|tara:strand:- start:1144 stop:1608 length:465 start_codon:yes stop_codon:yes gene_type:complete
MKKVADSQVIMHELVLPNDTNILGNILGGRVMHYMDICAAMSAYKHARTPVATASVDNLDFLAPAKMGEIICLKSSVNYTGGSSMEVGVRIESENAITGKIKHTASAYLTFVSLDKNKEPQKVESVKPKTDDEIRRFNEGERRYIHRKKRRNKS